jgi:hypothetical protein
VDEQERLIARAALCDAEEASAAWDEFRATVDLQGASPLLSWAGGYIHRNLESLGRTEPYLAGIARHNWLGNNRVLAKAQGILSELNSRWNIVPLKSFGLSSEMTDRRLRPLADIDLYVERTDIPGVVAMLRARGFVPLLDVSELEFSSRILPRRGSWNFRNADGLDIDVHWKIFDHLDASLNARLVKEHSANADASYGQIRQLVPELMVTIMCVQRQVQPVYSLPGLFDVNNLLKQVDPRLLISIAKSAGSEDALSESVLAIAGILGSTPIHLQAILDLLPVISPDAPTHILTRRFFSAAPMDTWDSSLVRNRLLYWAWWKLGHFARAERLLLSLCGPFSRGGIDISGDEAEVLPFRDLTQLGPGWHYCYPGNDFRWANRPDARCILAVDKGSELVITIIADAQMWSLTPVESIVVYLDGIQVSAIQRTSAEMRFTIPARKRLRRMELSFRPGRHVTYRNLGIDTNWYGLAIPLDSINTSPSAF